MGVAKKADCHHGECVAALANDVDEWETGTLTLAPAPRKLNDGNAFTSVKRR